MKKHFIYFIWLLGFYCTNSMAQIKNNSDSTYHNSIGNDSVFLHKNFIPGNYLYMDVDVLDNIYLITAGNQLKKINANGDSVAVFNDVKKYGNPSMIDVSNPLKLLVYYQNFSTVVILDRLLTFRNSIDFRKMGIFSVKALATSYDNNIWLFDEQDLKLKKIDDDGKVLLETTDWRQLFDPVPSPTQITDQDNFVYLYDESKGFFIFDYYGTLKNNLPFLHWQHIAISNSNLYGFANDKLYSYELKSLNLKSYTIPAHFNDNLNIKAINGKIYILRKEGVEIYNVK
ncbi:MAG: hypothetical protein ABJA37_02165 [Ferruginibacter sp.]